MATVLGSSQELHFLQDGRPIRGVPIEIYLGKPGPANDLPYWSTATDSAGSVVVRDLSMATYYVRFQSERGSKTLFRLEVPVEEKFSSIQGGTEMQVLPLASPTVQDASPRVPARLAAPSLHAQLQQLRGVVIDPSGAFIPNVEIEVTRTEGEHNEPVAQLGTDTGGGFYLDLRSGSYVVAFKFPGFVYQRVAVSIDPKGWQGMQLALALGNVCGHNAPGHESTIAELK